ncbi:extended synaptotagmin-2-like isoform X2 [Palaemon carinicauda]|uniref:extended synaptotagmin-2-like isoform X2 n=1 Tax=Palaemon carinicauda TaxID=392227 RepID=UPI0035B58EDB
MLSEVQERFISFLQRILKDVNETISGANALVPWFDLPLFLRELIRALCIFILVRTSLISSALVILYLIITARGDERPPNPKTTLTLSTVFEVSAAFVFKFIFVMLFYFVPFPSLVFLTFVWTCLDSYWVDRKLLDERLLLEEIDDERLGILLQRLGMHVPAWLSTPDHQRVEWLNKIILKLWPHIGHNIEDIVGQLIENKTRSELKVKELNHGNSAPRVSSVKIRERDEQMFIDVSIIYAGDFLACVEWHTGIEFKVEKIKVEADIQIELKNFVGHKPFVETLVVHMDKPPIINPEFTKLAKTVNPFKKPVLEYVQKAVQDNFPLTIQLGPDDAETQSESNKSTPSKSKNSLWDIVSSRPLLDETKPSQIVSFLQERNGSRKTTPDPETSEANDSSLKTKDSLKKSSSQKETDEANWNISSSFTEVSKSSKSQEVASLMTSSSQSQDMSVDWYISSPSTQSLLSVSNASQVSISSAGNESSDWLSSESAVTIGSPSSESLVSLSAPDSEILKINSDTVLDQDIHTPRKLQDSKQYSGVNNIPEIVVEGDIVYDDRLSMANDQGVMGHAYTSPGSLDSRSSEIKTDISTSSGGLKDELRAAIARDVEASRRAFLDRILTESEIDDEYRKKQEIIEPDISVSRESLTRIKDTDQGHGCIELTTRYQAPNIFIVTIHQVRNLPKRLNRTPNPYVKLYIQNQQLKPITEVTTDILENTQNPVFEKSFEFHLEHPLSLYTLRVSAKTKHKMAHKLGEVVLCFARYTSSQVVKERNWYNLSDPKKDYVLCWVGYRDPADANHKEIDRVEYSDEFIEKLL